MRKNCNGPAIAAAAHERILSLNLRRNKNGKSAKTAKKTRYHVSASFGETFGFPISKRLKYQADSSAATHTSPTAGMASRDSNFVTPSNKATSSNARPKTGDGLASGKRSVAMMSRRNGRMAEHAGRIEARSAGLVMSSPRRAPDLKTSGEYLRRNQMLTAKKNTAKAPNRKNDVGKPVSVAGILKINATVAARVSNRAMTTDKIEAVITASAIAR